MNPVKEQSIKFKPIKVFSPTTDELLGRLVQTLDGQICYWHTTRETALSAKTLRFIADKIDAIEKERAGK